MHLSSMHNEVCGHAEILPKRVNFGDSFRNIVLLCVFNRQPNLLRR